VEKRVGEMETEGAKVDEETKADVPEKWEKECDKRQKISGHSRVRVPSE